ncbi:MAG: pyridoxal phosphate-dependent aminotransferase [Patescibacteria group bacterium]|nr:MAG: pyridoxal phosphate-dependent aminotransferase [Patescibacteria group bacterium]
MRNDIVHGGAEELTYEIREIVEVGEALEGMGVSVRWENIGDPVAKGHEVPGWIKERVNIAVVDDENFGYSPTKGLLKTREFLARLRAEEEGPAITAEDILFFNGLGDAISKVYTYLRGTARVIGPTPAYPTHSSAEGAHAGDRHIAYDLNPHRNWLPDLEDLRNKVRYNPSVSGILIINPGNPTGTVCPERVLREIVKIAKEFDLFLIADEIYANIVHEDKKMVPLRQVLGSVPAIVMRGLSKEIPWPGARCGWIEVYNKERDPVFARYVKTLHDAKALEVCSTTLPQAVLPDIFSDERYRLHLREKARLYGRNAEIAWRALRNVHGILAPKPEGAFYLSVVFEDGAIKEDQKLDIKNKKVKEYIEGIVHGIPADKRFVYYLMAATGICVVPLSGFHSPLSGFRITLLESDKETFTAMIREIADAITAYLNSK